jgi:hypothetical protein
LLNPSILSEVLEEKMNAVRITQGTQIAGLLALTLTLVTFFGPVYYSQFTVPVYWVTVSLAMASIINPAEFNICYAA